MKITRWQRLLCLVLAAVLILQAAPVTAFARETEPAAGEERVAETRPAQPLPTEPAEILPPEPEPEAEVCSETDFTYTALDETTCEITKYTGTAKDVVIPEVLDGYTVTRIGDSVFKQKSITSVVIPDTVTELGTGVFSSCYYLTQVTIPDGITVIPANTFYYCTALTSVELPSGVTEIGAYAFDYCYKLTSIELPQSLVSLGKGAFWSCSGLTSITIPDGVTALPEQVFQSCEKLAEVVLPDGLTELGANAFYCCFALTGIEIPEGVTVIPNDCFRGCSKLSSVVLPEGLTEIQSYGFYSCDALATIELPEGLETLGTNVFAESDGLTRIKIPAGVTVIPEDAFSNCVKLSQVELPETLTEIQTRGFFGCDALETIELPQSLVSMGEAAFSNCDALTSVTIPASLTALPTTAFSWCAKLSEVELPEGMTSIGKQAFLYCDSLETVELPQSLVSLGTGVFNGCDGLTHITIPDGVTVLPADTFIYCPKLESVELPEGLTSIGEDAFNECTALTGIVIPQSVVKLGSCAFLNCSALTSVTIPDGITALPEGLFNGCAGLNEVVLPEGVTSIGNAAFSRCKALASIDLPEGLESLGSMVFSDCDAMETIELPQSLVRLDSGVFSGCDALKSITIPDGITKLPGRTFEDCVSLIEVKLPPVMTGLGSYVFAGCTALTEIVIPQGITAVPYAGFRDCTSLRRVVLPEGVKSVEYLGFDGCIALEEINLPDSLVTLADRAFSNCDALTEIALPASLKTLGENAFADCDALVSIDIPEGLTTWRTFTFANCDALTTVTIPGTRTTVPEGTFYNCGKLSNVVLGEGITTLGNKSFRYCDSLESITLPQSLTAMGSYVFQDCDALTGITIPDGVTSIPTDAFEHCDSLSRVELPDALTRIGSDAFSQCDLLEEIELPEGLLTLDSRAFEGCDGLTRITLPDSVTKIGDECFINCKNLSQVDFSAALTTIGNSAFKGCVSLESVSLPEGLTTLSYSCFQDCNNLVSADLPDSLTTMGHSCFRGCNNLVSVDLSEGLTTIPSYAFYGCSAMRSIEIPAAVTKIEDYAFYGCTGLLSAVIYDGVTSIGDRTFMNCPELTIQTIPGSYVWDYAVSKEIKVVDMDDGLSVLWLDVTDASGAVLEKGFTVSWYRPGEDEPFATGTILRGLESGSYEYELILDETLCFDYVQPQRQTVEIRGGVVELELVLQPLGQILLTGIVKNTAGEPIPGAKLSLIQSVGSAERTYEAAADDSGAYAVRLSALDTTGVITADGYFSRELSLELSGCTSDMEYNAELIELPSNKIAVQLSVRRAGSTTRTDLPNSDVNLSFRVENLTRGTTVTGHEYQHGSLMLPEGTAAANEKLRITATDRDGTLADAAVEIKLDAQNNGTARFEFVEHGRFELTALTGCENIAMLLFDGQGRFVTSAPVDSGYTSDALAPGSYSVVLMEQNSLIRTTDKLENLTIFGLEAGVDYIVKTLRISDGEITRIASVFVPALDPDRFNYTVEANTGFTVNEDTPFAGEYIVLRLAYEIDEKYPASGEKIQIRLAEEMGMAGESLTLDGKRHMYAVDDGVLTVDTDQRSGIIRLYIQPNFVGRYCVEATLQFTSGDKVLTQPLGSVDLNVVAAEYDLTEKTCNGKVPVIGTAIPDSTIVFYEWGEEIATTTSNAAGSFRAELPLRYAGKYSYHEITATVENDKFDQLLDVEAQTVINDTDYAMVSKVTMIRGGTHIVLDYLYPGPTPMYVSPAAVNTWTYIVEFVDDGAQKVENVVVHTGTNAWNRNVECVYDEANDRWIGTGDDPWGVSVSYDIIYPEIDEDAPLELDDELIDKAMEEYEKSLEEIEKEMEDVGAEDPEVFEDMTLDELFVYITKYNQLAKEAADDLDNADRAAGNDTVKSDGTTTDVDLGKLKGTVNEKPADPDVANNPGGSGYKPKATGDQADVYSKDLGNGKQEYLVVPKPPADDSAPTESPVVITVDPVLPDPIPEGDYDALDAYLNTAKDNLDTWLDILGEYYDEYDYPAQLKKLEDLARENENARNALKAAKKKIDGITDSAEKKAYQNDYNRQADLLKKGEDRFARSKAKLGWWKNGIKGALSFLGVVGLIDNINGLMKKMDRLKRIGETMPAVCPGEEAAYDQLGAMIDLTAKYIGSTGAMSIGADAISVAASFGMITVAPVGLAAKIAFDGAITAGQIALDQQTERMLNQLEARLGALDCNGDGQPDGYTPKESKEGNRTIIQTVAMRLYRVLDPSGFVYEAVPSNRVEGVKASCYYLGYALDEYGIPKEEPEDILWNAEDFDQINPVYTDENGRFKWDVPEGKWIVKFSKEGYYDTDSSKDPAAVDGYLPVPPPQMEVNTAIVSKAAPEVENVNIYEDQIQILFSQYMQPDTVTEKTVTVTSGGKTVAGTLSASNAEYNYEQTARYASVFTFVPAEKLEGTVDIQIGGCINYAGKSMTEVYACSGKVYYRPERIAAGPEYTAYWNETGELEIQILPAQAGAGRTITVRNVSELVLECARETVTADEAGRATLPLTGLLPGGTQIVLELEGTDISATVDVTVVPRPAQQEQCEKVTANLPGGSIVAPGTELILSTATEGAQIYYTLDGTCPCVENSPSRILYAGPIALTEDTFLIAYAVKAGFADSVTAGFVYSICTHTDTLLDNERGATCTEDGYSGDVICDYCGTVVETGSVIPATGHSFGAWAAAGNGMEERSCTRCGFTEQRPASGPVNPFADVPEGSFYYEPVLWAVEEGITNGTTPTTFGPNDQCMRAHVVTFLWRAAGSPEPTQSDNPFVDVKSSDFYYKAVLWAVEKGVTNGLDATHFGPFAYCNRAQVVTFLYRSLGSPAVESRNNPFTDVPEGQWFTAPVLWAVDNGVTNGLSATTFGPNSICNRAQIVTFLYRAYA